MTNGGTRPATEATAKAAGIERSFCHFELKRYNGWRLTGKLFTGPGTCGETDVRGRGCGMDVDEDVDVGVDVGVGLRLFVLRLFGLACNCWRCGLPPVSRSRRRVPLCSVFVYVPAGGPVDGTRIHTRLRNTHITVTC